MKPATVLAAFTLAISPLATDAEDSQPAVDVLDEITITEDHSMDGYDRDNFAPSGWVDANNSGCTTREDILARDLDNTQIEDCTVEYGEITGAYSGEPIEHVQGESQVDIEHVVAVGQAWRNGAHSWDEETMQEFYQDEDNLIAVGSSENQAKGDDDVTDYMPPNESIHCEFAASKVYVKEKYDLAMNPAEHEHITEILEDPECENTPAASAEALYSG